MPIGYRRTCFYFIRAVLFTPEHIRLRAGARFQSASANLSLITALVTTELSFSLSWHAVDEILLLTVMPLLRNCVIFSFSRLSTRQMLPPASIHSSRLDFVCHLSQEPSSSFREIPIPTRKIPVCRAVSTTFARQSRSILPSWALEPAVRAVVATNALSRQINSRCSVSKSIKLPGLVQSRKFRGSSTIVMVQRVEKSDTEWAKEVRNRNQDPTRAHRPSRSEPRR